MFIKQFVEEKNEQYTIWAYATCRVKITHAEIFVFLSNLPNCE